jgi:hypothetical protein
MRLLDAIRRLLRAVFLGIAAVVVFIEEVGWRPLSAWVARLAQWPPLHRLEERIRRLPPLPAMGLFGVPAVVLFPLKLAALAVIQAGHAALGVLVIVLAKLLGTALVGRLFVLLEPQLMSFAWFRVAHDWWVETRLGVRAVLRRSAAWRRVRMLRCGWRRWRRRRPA